jgi:hypothetical protein
VWRAYTGVIHFVFDQISKLQNCFTTQNKNLGGKGGLRQINTCRQVPLLINCFTALNKNLGEEGRGPLTDKHLPPITFTGQFLSNADI